MMIDPPIERVLDKAGGRFKLVLLSARRARDITDYYKQLREETGLREHIPPQVHSLSAKPLSIALEEIAEDKTVVAAVEE